METLQASSSTVISSGASLLRRTHLANLALRQTHLANSAQPPGACSCGGANLSASSSAFVDSVLKEAVSWSSSSRRATATLYGRRFSSSLCSSWRSCCCGISTRRSDHDRRSALRSRREYLRAFSRDPVVDGDQCRLNQSENGCTLPRFHCLTCGSTVWRTSAARRAPESVFAPVQFHRKSPLQDPEDAVAENFADEGLSAPSSFLQRIHLQKEWLFGPAIFNASKLRVLLPGKQDDERPWQHPRVYTLTHCDLTAEMTLTVAREINKTQVKGWYSKLQRDEVLAEWRRTRGEMSLHVHCHISGSNRLHTLVAKLRFYMFQKELPLVIESFLHGDRKLFRDHPELHVAPVWVYFHSNVEKYNRVEYWGPVLDAAKKKMSAKSFLELDQALGDSSGKSGQRLNHAEICLKSCECCSRHANVIPIPESLKNYLRQPETLHTSTLRAL